LRPVCANISRSSTTVVPSAITSNTRLHLQQLADACHVMSGRSGWMVSQYIRHHRPCVTVKLCWTNAACIVCCNAGHHTRILHRIVRWPWRNTDGVPVAGFAVPVYGLAARTTCTRNVSQIPMSCLAHSCVTAGKYDCISSGHHVALEGACGWKGKNTEGDSRDVGPTITPRLDLEDRDIVVVILGNCTATAGTIVRWARMLAVQLTAILVRA
jgi:hypothetical protein